MACSLLMLSACRPKTEELAPEKQTARNKNAGENYVPSPKLGGKQNPYSLKSIREAKDAFREISMLSANDIKEFDNLRQDIAQNLANTPINPQDLQLYVSWQPSVKSQTEDFAQILKSDTTIRVLPFPLDSTSYTTQEMEATQQFLMPDALAGGWQSRTLVEHAEINEMFYNDFIPCGLFYDLMDANPNPSIPNRNETYDRISGYTTKQIFDLLQRKVESMQTFKVRFEETYGANADTQDLFQRYGL